MKSRGSTLLLGMVIVSIVLASGVGVSTLLLRQMRGVGDKETAAIAFYVADTIAEGILKEEFILTDDFLEIDWSDMGLQRNVAYKAREDADKYRIVIRIEDDYYSFDRAKTQEENGNGIEEGIFTIHYNNPNNWEEVGLLYEENGEYPCKSMNESGEWFEYDIDATTIEEEKTRAIFHENSDCSGADDGIYPNLSENLRYWYLEEVSEIYILGELVD